MIATPLAHLNSSREVLLVWVNATASVASTENIPVEERVPNPEITDDNVEQATDSSAPATDTATEAQ